MEWYYEYYYITSITACIVHVFSYHLQYPMKYECFDSLSLTLPREATQVHNPLHLKKNPLCIPYIPSFMLSQVTLHNCLLEFTKPEIVHDVDCPQCSKVC